MPENLTTSSESSPRPAGPAASGSGGVDRALEAIDTLPERFAALRERVGRVVVGQDQAVRLLLLTTFCQGHALLVGPPGLAKTLLVKTLASCLRLSFQRIQCTPDLMPGDVIGSELLEADRETGRRRMRFARGPVFANIVLADELNRTPPKTQAALLEAMAEGQVSVGRRTRRLPQPFMVVATQNPIEQEGTYPLPEAQLDRFLCSVRLEYPSEAQERRIAAQEAQIDAAASEATPLFDGPELLRLREIVAQMPVSDSVAAHAVALARATRPQDPACPAELRRLVAWGAGPRAPQAMLRAARCLAAVEGAPTPTIGHVRALATPILRHRLVLGYAAAAEGLDADAAVAQAMRAVK